MEILKKYQDYKKTYVKLEKDGTLGKILKLGVIKGKICSKQFQIKMLLANLLRFFSGPKMLMRNLNEKSL